MDNKPPKKKKTTLEPKIPSSEPESSNKQGIELEDYSKETQPKSVVSIEPNKTNQLTPVKSKAFFSNEEKKRLELKKGINPLILLLGLLFLAALGLVVWKNLPQNKQILLPTSSAYNPVTKIPVSFTLEITNPDDELLVFDKSIVVSGKTTPKTTVVINDDGELSTTEADSNGQFSKVIVLDTGVNKILIHGVDTQGNSKEDHRTVYYSEEKI